jgi:hypothetical protein
MKPHQARVVQEKKDLDTKLNKLLDFMESEEFRKLDRYEQLLMREQYHFMRHYSWILDTRLNYWQDLERIMTEK